MRIAMLLCCFVGALPMRAQDDVLMRAMRDEMARSMKEPQLANLEKPYFIAYRATERDVSSLRMAFNSCRRFSVVLGYAIFSSLSVSRTIWETISRAFSLSSAGTAYQGA